MSNRLFNTPFEFSLHVLLMLEETKLEMTIDIITALDFLASHAIEAVGSDSALSGLAFSELAAKRNIMYNAVTSLVLDELIKVHDRETGMPESMRAGLFRYFMNHQDEGQLIIIENPDHIPALDYAASGARVETFTKTKEDGKRYGFLNEVY